MRDSNRIMGCAALAGMLFAGAGSAYGEVNTFSMSIVCDNDYAVFAGTNTSIVSLLYQNDVDWGAQIANISSQTFSLPNGCTTIYLLAMDGGGEANIQGTINDVDITSVPVLMSVDIGSHLTDFGFSASAIADGSYSPDLADVQTAMSSLSSTDWTDTPYIGSGIVTGASGYDFGFLFNSDRAHLFAFEATGMDIPVVSVPEPATTSLAIAFLGGAFVLIRRRKQK